MPKKDKRSGSALVLAALFLLVLIPMIGLAIDGTNVYLMRNQMQTALNAAVLAGNRSLSLGTDITSQTASAAAVANMTFSANILGMSLTGTPPAPSFIVSEDPTTKIVSVTGSASASVPLMMMGMIVHPAQMNISVTAASSRRSVNIMLVLDHSGPMLSSLPDLKADAIDFVNMFVNGTDNIGLVTFTAAPYVAATLPNLNFQSNVPADISLMNAPGGTYTNTSAAMWVAYQQLQSLNQPGALNVMVLFTDGLAGAFTGTFATSGVPCNQATTTGVLWSNQNPTPLAIIGGLTATMAQSVMDTPESSPAGGCTAISTRPNSFVSSMPAADIYGNSISGYQPVNPNIINWQNISYASENALDAAASRIRTDPNNPATIFVIGLGGNTGAYPPDPVLMPRIANDPSSAYYQSSQPTGQYIFAPGAAELQNAFTGIASQVLKLAR